MSANHIDTQLMHVRGRQPVAMWLMAWNGRRYGARYGVLRTVRTFLHTPPVLRSSRSLTRHSSCTRQTISTSGSIKKEHSHPYLPLAVLTRTYIQYSSPSPLSTPYNPYSTVHTYMYVLRSRICTPYSTNRIPMRAAQYLVVGNPRRRTAPRGFPTTKYMYTYVLYSVHTP